MNQGVRRQPIFEDDADRFRFIEDFRHSCREHSTEIAAYCLMGNHFHGVVRCRTGELSETLQQMGTRYARAFNFRHGHVGPVFRSRFTSVAIEDDGQLVTAIRYVHRNPLELGYDIASYPWSSHRHYLGFDNLKWIASELPLELLGGRAAYRQFVAEPMTTDAFSVDDGVRQVSATKVGPGFNELDEAVASLGSRLSRRDSRILTALVAIDVLCVEPAQVVEHLVFPSMNAFRSSLSRARRRQSRDLAFSSHVNAVVARLLDVAA